MNTSISKISRILLFVTALLLVAAIFLPLWVIELQAPQYPEGLVLKMYTYGLAGQVDIINGLNHYIGMGTLHSENFIEFTVLPYIIGFFAFLALINAVWANKMLLYTIFISFLLFGILSMVDFWRWEYDYGHNLDPHAAIVVPGMAYQPPLIGFKQLLNFGAYSIPDIGGWFFIISGMLLLCAILIENKKIQKLLRMNHANGIVLITMLCLTSMSCDYSKPVPIQLNKDACDYCKMAISDAKFCSEIITDKGRCYKFDDVHCMASYKKDNSKIVAQYFYVHDFNSTDEFINIANSFLVECKSFKSPMGGNTATVKTKEQADILVQTYPEAKIVSWNALLNQ
jgi:copper chaperone NosL